MAPPLVPLVVGFSNGFTSAAAPRLRPVAMMSGRPSLWDAYGPAGSSEGGGGSDAESTRDSSPPLLSPPPPPVSRPQPPCSPQSPPPVAYAAATPVATKMDEDRRCTVCVALLGQYGKVEALLEGGCGGSCSTVDGGLDYGGFSALVDAVEVQCSGPSPLTPHPHPHPHPHPSPLTPAPPPAPTPTPTPTPHQVQCSEPDKRAIFAMVESGGTGTVDAAHLHPHPTPHPHPHPPPSP